MRSTGYRNALLSLLGLEQQTGKSEAGRPPLLALMRLGINVILQPILIWIWSTAAGCAIGPGLLIYAAIRAFVNFRTGELGLVPAFRIADGTKDTNAKKVYRKHVLMSALVGIVLTAIWQLGSWPHPFIRWLLVWTTDNKPRIAWEFRGAAAVIVPWTIIWMRASIVVTFPMYAPGILGDLDWRLALESLAPNLPNTITAKPGILGWIGDRLSRLVGFTQEDTKPEPRRQTGTPNRQSSGEKQVL